MTKQFFLTIQTQGKGFYNITQKIINQAYPLPNNGIMNVFLQHTSAGLTINENADPDVLTDLNRFLENICPETIPWFLHSDEGNDDMPAHIKSSLISVSLTIPIINQKPALGTWQGIYLCEFRKQPHARKIIVTII
ncbi:MAG TPA: secondary thiamine-phosphate synthase enzyme YjbQ, partial [Salinivirgaceae bacterium]|nr:secondary thiamine-phosphate synthase enzyme YjbQ [Salinivirgaceae bacterium]